MTRYIAAYDTESPACLAACRKIVEVHHRHEMPATFFITGEKLHADAAEYRQLLDHPLFEIASHTWSHQMILDHPWCGPAVPMSDIAEEIARGKDAVETVFGRPCAGLRPGCGFDGGLQGAGEILRLVRDAGHKYVSSLVWGRDYTLPAPLHQPFTYERDGLPDLWELPGHGWHDNLLKNANKFGPRRMSLWPPAMPEETPAGFVKKPQEEFAVHRMFLQRAVEEDLPFVSLIWHPWSLYQFDPEMQMLDLVFSHVRELGLEPTTYGGLYEHLSTSSDA